MTAHEMSYKAPHLLAEQKLKRSVGNLNLDECTILETLDDPDMLHRFDMNKVLDSDDEVNTVKRKARNRAQLAIVRPWQNKMMARFLLKLFEEAGPDRVLQKTTVINKYNQAGVPITWNRIAPENIYFEKKQPYPPWAPTTKVTLILPMKPLEENLKDLESLILTILFEKIS